MNKEVYKYSDIRQQIIEAVDLITDPVRQTMGPKGGNVIYENNHGEYFVTNDGVTIAKNISVADPIKNAIIEIIKGSSLKTNQEAGDGTSSTILLSSILVKGGLDLIDKGYNQIEVRDAFNLFAEKLKKEVSLHAIKVKTDKDLFNIANISANNDSVIAQDVVKTIKIVGEDGLALIDKSYTDKTEIVEDNGFISSGIFVKEIAGNTGKVSYTDVPVLVTDKRLYYKQEALTILTKVKEAGYDSVVIVASDFIGEALPYFVANHQQGIVDVLLIKESDPDKLTDIATYLGGKVISDKNGNIVNNISIDDMMTAKMVYADQYKSIISHTKKTKELTTRISVIREEMERIGNKNSSDYDKLKSRLASLTRGMVTIKVGGSTEKEVIEKMFRYEDAINATRASISDGYLPGGGVSIYNAHKNIQDKFGSDYNNLFSKVCSANILQVANNAGAVPELILSLVNDSPAGHAYNAQTGKVENMVKAGVIEPLKVVNQVISNSVSIANLIVTSKYLIVNELENNK